MPPVTGTVTDPLTSTYCDKCEETFVTIYPVTYIDVCPTGTTASVYTITETATGNPASFTPTSCPAGFTTYVTECTVCEESEKTITVTAPMSSIEATTTAAPETAAAPETTAAAAPAPETTAAAPEATAPAAAPAAPAAYTPAPAPKVKPAGGTSFAYTPPAPTSTGGPQLVSVSAASASGIQFLTIMVGAMGAGFVGLLML